VQEEYLGQEGLRVRDRVGTLIRCISLRQPTHPAHSIADYGREHDQGDGANCLMEANGSATAILFSKEY
jgi:hypothetical protein